MHTEIAQHRVVDVELGVIGRAEARAPAARSAVLVDEDVGFGCGETLLAHLKPYCPYAIEIGDRRRVVSRMIDAPGRAVRPVERDAISELAAEQRIDRHAERFR